MLRTTVARSLSELEAHEEQWNRLVELTPHTPPMLTYGWVSAYFKYRLDSNEEWICIFAYDADQLIGVLPLIVHTINIFGLKRPALRTPTDSHTRSVDMLISAEFGESAGTALLAAVESEYPKRQWIQFSPILETSPTLSLARALQSHGQAITLDEITRGAYLPIEGTFEQFRSALPKKFRGNLNNARNKLQKLNKPLRTTFIDAASVNGDELERFMDIEASSWKGEKGSAILRSKDLIRFYTDIDKDLSRSNMMLWCFLSVGEQVIASNMCIKIGDIVYLWKLGYDDDFGKFSPGSVLFEELVKYAFQNQSINEINLMTEPNWCSDWNMKYRTYFNLKVCRAGFVPSISFYYPKRALYFLKAHPILIEPIKAIRNIFKKDSVKLKKASIQ